MVNAALENNGTSNTSPDLFSHWDLGGINFPLGLIKYIVIVIVISLRSAGPTMSQGCKTCLLMPNLLQHAPRMKTQSWRSQKALQKSAEHTVCTGKSAVSHGSRRSDTGTMGVHH